MELPTQSLRDVSEGIIQRVDGKVRPPNSVWLGLNVLFDSYLGRAVLRGGTTQIGSTIASGKSCLGLGQHITTGGLQVPIAVFNHAGDGTADLYRYDGASWAVAKAGLTAGAKMRFITFLNTTVGLNGTDKITSPDGAGWAIAGGALDVDHMPQGQYALEFLDKVLVAGVSTNPDTLYMSSTPVAGAVSWTSGNDSIDIEPEEGAGPIVGLAKVPGYALIFKERSMKRWDTKSTYPESMMTIGAKTQEAIVQARQSVLFYNPVLGIFETNGALPRRLSKRIQEIIDAVPPSYYPSISGGSDADRVYYSIGDITLGNLNLTNCVIAYSLDFQHFTLLSFPNEYRFWSRRVGQYSNETLMVGDDNGAVWDILEGIGDGASNAQFDYIVEWSEIEFGSRGLIKNSPKMVTYTQDIKQGTVSVRVDRSGDYKSIGVINKDVMEVTRQMNGRYFDIRISGRGASGHIIGIDFPDLSVTENFNA